MSEGLRYVMLALLLVCASASAERDPTRPPASWAGVTDSTRSRPAAGELQLNAVLYSEQRRRARIGDHWLGIGEEIDGARLVEIRRDRVRLLRDSGPVVLMLGGADAPALGKVFRERKR